MKKGKALEQLVGYIQEFVSDTPSTSVYVGKRINDNNGIPREIDVLVETIVQGISIYMAFECKDYSTSLKKTKVDVKVVDAFIGKCKDIPQICSKIIVSTTGFTDSAILKARNNGVLLYPFEDVPFSEIILKNDVYTAIPEFDIKNIKCIIQDYDRVGFFYEVPALEIIFDDTRLTAENIFKGRIHKMSAEEYAPLANTFFKLKKSPFRHYMSFSSTKLLHAVTRGNKKCYVMAFRYEMVVDFKLTNGVLTSCKKIKQGMIDVKATEFVFEDTESRMVVIENGNKSTCLMKTNNGYFPFEYENENV